MTVRFGETIHGLVAPKLTKTYTGEIVSMNPNGTYQVWVRELGVIYPQVARSGPDRRRLSPLERCVLKREGLALEIL